jgi:hypothetical protein
VLLHPLHGASDLFLLRREQLESLSLHLGPVQFDALKVWQCVNPRPVERDELSFRGTGECLAVSG